MTLGEGDLERARRWARQWIDAGSALAAQRRRDLVAVTDEQALAAADALLSIAPVAPLPEGRWSTSGLVEQQALLQRRPGG